MAQELILAPKQKRSRYDIEPDESDVDEILFRLAQGETLRSITKDEHLPGYGHVLRWVTSGKHPEVTRRFVAALASAGHAAAERMHEVLRGLEMGIFDPQTARVMIDALKWIAERQCPQFYTPQRTIQVADGTPIEGTQSRVILVNFVD